ncbi:hypothetical protein [Marinicella sp. W31]
MTKDKNKNTQIQSKDLKYNPFPKEFIERIRELNHKIAMEEIAKMDKRL